MRQWASCRLRGDVSKRRLVPFQTMPRKCAKRNGQAGRRTQAGSSKQHKPKAQDSYDQVQGKPMGPIHGP